MSFQHVVGIDVSKKTFDACLCLIDSSDKTVHKLFKNNSKGISQFIAWLKKAKVDLSVILVCLENTGIYHRPLVKQLQKLDVFVWVENAVQIKWSQGIQRGKNDKIDSKRILTYACRNIDKAKNYMKKSQSIDQIADYLSVRSRLMDCIKAIKAPIKELKALGLEEEAKRIEMTIKQSLHSLKIELKQINNLILETIEKDEILKKKYELCSSVKSIGFVSSCYLLVYTNGFTRFKNAKQLASFAGVAPFEYSSGTSIKGRTRVHHMANKKLKTAIHMSAVSSLRFNEEMKTYFARKVREGKNKMSVLNAIRNKLLARVFACVKNERMYNPGLNVY